MPANKRLLSTKEVVNMALNEKEPLNQIPCGEKSNCCFVVDKRFLPSDSRGTVFYDDCGFYSPSNGHTYHLIKPDLTNIIIKGKTCYRRSKGNLVEIIPRPEENQICHVFDRTATLKLQPKFKRRISTFKDSNNSSLNHLAVIQYSGTFIFLVIIIKGIYDLNIESGFRTNPETLSKIRTSSEKPAQTYINVTDESKNEYPRNMDQIYKQRHLESKKNDLPDSLTIPFEYLRVNFNKVY